MRGLLPTAIRNTFIFGCPSAIVLAVLVGYGELSLGAALIAWLVILLGSFALILPVIAVLHRLAEPAESDRGAPPSAPWPGLVRDVATVFGRLTRDLRDRDDQLTAAIGANETILQSLPDPLLLMTDDQTISFANAAAEAVFGDGLVGRELATVLRAPAVLAAAEAVNAGAGPREVAYEIGGDQPRRFVGRMQVLGDAFPTRGAIALLLHDVTELWRTERLRADFVANASHEIRTPLATLVGAVETMLGPARDDPEARQRFLEMMQDHAQRIERLVDDLLSLSRIERVEHEAPNAAVGLHAVLQLAITTLDWKAQARSVTVKLDLADDLAGVSGDADELGQVFQNLIDNAIKYGDPESDVTVTVRPVEPGTTVEGWQAQGPALAVTVADHGPGIPPEHLPRLTERFYRVDKARSRQLGGTGLGLAIVKHIVARHRGALAIESEPGQGSRFTVYLNIAAKNPESGPVT
jgi:two-component system phosphate regulon sensor histidine kinase PhoR